MKLYLHILSALVIMCLSLNSFSQCKTFTKKECLPKLSPYIHNGQLNSVMLYPGESATLKQTFYSGQDYRLIACSQEDIMSVKAYFVISDSEGNVVFNGEDQDGNWDFNVNSTQELQIEVKVPRMTDKRKPVQEGCTALLVGFK